jgi:hypothetical protein
LAIKGTRRADAFWISMALPIRGGGAVPKA